MLTVSGYGNLGKDPEAFTTATGSSGARFSVACRNSRGETTWMSCTAWGKVADVALNYLTKGSAVAFSGGLSSREVDRNDGARVTYYEVTIDHLTLGGKSAGDQQSSGTRSTTKAPEPSVPGLGDRQPAPDDEYDPFADE